MCNKDHAKSDVDYLVYIILFVTLLINQAKVFMHELEHVDLDIF